MRPISGFSPMTGGCRPWKVHATGGSASNSTSKRCSPSVHGGSRSSDPINQLTRTVMTGSPPTVPCQVNRCAATVPFSITPTGVSRSLVATGHLVLRPLLRVELPSRLGTDHVDRLHEAMPEDLDHRALRGDLGRLAEQHHLAHDHVGRVVADVGELLGPHMANVAAQRRQHQREPLGDPAGIDPGAVQRRLALRGTRPGSRRRRECRPDRSSPPASRRSCPTPATGSRRGCWPSPANRRLRPHRARRCRRCCPLPSPRWGRDRTAHRRRGRPCPDCAPNTRRARARDARARP